MQVSEPRWSMDEDGARISFRLQSVAEAKELCQKMEPGRLYDLTVKKRTKKRSLSANSLMWAVLGEMAVVLRGVDPKVTPDELYLGYIRESPNYVVGDFWEDMVPDLIRAWEGRGLGWQAQKLQTVEEADGRIKWSIRFWRGSSDYSTAEMAQLIDSILQDANALGICSENMKALMEAYPNGQ